MSQQQSQRTRVLGYLLLTLSFVAAGLVFASAGFRVWTEEGMNSATILAAFAVLGTISLSQRYARMAREASRVEARVHSRRR